MNLTKAILFIILCFKLISCTSFQSIDKDAGDKLSIGLMSGTSMDGIDAALLKTNGIDRIKFIHGSSLDYDPQFKILLRSAEYSVRKHKGNLNAARTSFDKDIIEYLKQTYNDPALQITKLAYYLYEDNPQNIQLDDIINYSTTLHAKAVNKLLKKTNIRPEDVDIVGFHGQTLYHNPTEHITAQIGNGQLLSNKTKIKVVNNFRINDIKNGGNGAPLAPIYHQALAIKYNLLPTCIINLGGIANITVINGKAPQSLIAFDTGPANIMIDQYMRKKTSNIEFMDKDAKYGLKGKINNNLFRSLVESSVYQNGKNYLKISPPKSLDSKDFSLPSEIFSLSKEDACATLEAFTAYTIADSITSYIPPPLPKKYIIAGGGAYNPRIKRELKKFLIPTLGDDFEIIKADDIEGMSGKYMEAELFAYLAVRSYKGLPISFPLTTGVKFQASGGELYKPE